MISDLNQRSREIFRQIVDAYVSTGEPVGSRTVARRLTQSLSPATIRNVMADLEELGLLYAPHTSAGRIPTQAGLRLFVDGLLEIGAIGALTEAERDSIERQCSTAGRSLPDLLSEASRLLAGLSCCAGMVLAPKTDRPLRHIEFVSLGQSRALVVLVTEDGMVENRVIDVPLGVPAATLIMATNFLNARLVGRTLDEARQEVAREIDEQRSELDTLSSKVVAAGLATWAGGTSRTGQLIIRGQARLLEDVTVLADLERIRALFDILETREAMARLLEETGKGAGVQIFIGSENPLFNHTGCAMVVSPYSNSKEQIVGAIGVIGPTRINYARIIPLVDYTAKVIGRLIG